MEKKPARSKSKIFSFLPKTASVSFTNPPFSPGREKRLENFHKLKAAYAGKSFSGPIISIIPSEAPRKSKSGSFDAQEPTSPKVSCMGQIKHCKKISKSKDVSPREKKLKHPKQPKRSSSSIASIFRGRKSDSSVQKPPKVPEKVPGLGQMKRFSSGRDTFGSQFDWKSFDAKVVPNDHRKYYSDDEDRDDSFQEDDDDDEEVIVPHSAPLCIGGGRVPAGMEPRKEINLWKRRTMDPPRPLQLNGMGKA